jgi:hypothetical protein
MTTKPFPIRSLPGIKRDGTIFEGDNYTDGKWCRFQRGLPRKMFGYRAATNELPEIVRGMGSYSQGGVQYQHFGSASFLTQIRLNDQGQFTGLSNRTPAAYSPSADSLWQIEIIADSAGAFPQIIAHPGLNLNSIDNDTETPIYIGNVTANAVLVPSGLDPQSGGIVSLYPYVLTFGNFGRVDISDEEDLTVPPPDSVFAAGTKIIRGFSLRGGGGGPAGLLWSLDSLIRATFNSPNPADGIFAFDIIADDLSVLSSRSIINYDGVYYWPAVDRFQMFNGVVREIPNQLNLNYFFDNLNFTQRQKVFGYKVPRFGEIWWCYPRGNATECTHAVIYNVREQTWYDTLLPEDGRSDGIYAKVYSRPFMTSVRAIANKFTLWQHETGLDAINGSSIQPIESYFVTGDTNLMNAEDSISKSIRVERIEPDFVQAGPLTATVMGQVNPRATNVDSTSVTFQALAATPGEQVLDFKDAVRRLLRFKFVSNTSGGDYQLGQSFAHIEPNDGRLTQ